ncbi:hypothetical protein [Candidatus Nanopusillus massiliensis]|uniref:hypothetical protein n=1 Tax=Candidatus Nanopusillus massiliensis TaxID=2897163 RepID=UPI002112F2C5|nr:hypothetical protein [Candidatus Nanopusillus massiliensis]
MKYSGYLLSESLTQLKAHRMEITKDGLLYLSFEKYKRIPLIPLVRALGLEKDVEIKQLISEGDDFEEVYINLLEFQDIKTSEDAIRYLADKLKLTGSPEVKKEKLLSILDNLLLPNIGTSLMIDY